MDTPDSPAKQVRRDRFVKVAERRTTRVLKEISALAKCANRNAYLYESADIDQIFSAIEAELKTARSRFSRADKPQEVKFKLST